MKLSREKLKNIIKEELEEMMTDEYLQKTTPEDIRIEISSFFDLLTDLSYKKDLKFVDAYGELAKKLSDLQSKVNYLG